LRLLFTTNIPPGEDPGRNLVTSIPRWVAAHSEKVLAARGYPERLLGVFMHSPVPMVMLDDERRYVEANPAAQSALAMGIDELRRLRFDDLTAPYQLATLEAGWERLMETGCVTSEDPGRPEGKYLGLTTYAMAEVLPGRHVIAFAPAGWPETEALVEPDGLVSDVDSPLTPREREVLELAAGGLTGPKIARELVLSPATVRTHFGHIYQKLDVPDRAAAVAKAMRLGLIR
jgi:DNA-binding CsgD family transcriptional regulator